MSRPAPGNPATAMAVVFVGALLILSAGAAGVLLKFHTDRAEASTASATFDGIGPTQVGVQLYRGEGSLCRQLFTEPFETVIFVFRDGGFLTYSTHDEKHINVPISIIADDIIKSGRAISDCLLCVHNHFSPIGFTHGDELVYEHLKRRGFRGTFGIFYTATGRFLGVEE